MVKDAAWVGSSLVNVETDLPILALGGPLGKKRLMIQTLQKWVKSRGALLSENLPGFCLQFQNFSVQYRSPTAFS